MLQPFANLSWSELLMPVARFSEQVLFPKRCVFCGQFTTAKEGFVCHGCDAELPRIPHPCRSCAMPLPESRANETVCGACQARPPPFVAVLAPFEYRFPLDAAIKAMKFQRRLFFANAFRTMLVNAAGRLPEDIDGILPVPLHRLRKLRRGFNQADEIAVPLYKHLQTVRVRNVCRVRNTPYQSGLDASARQKNLRTAFKVRGSLGAKHVLIVDDVITTGATGKVLAQVLLNAGARAVSQIALARAV